MSASRVILPSPTLSLCEVSDNGFQVQWLVFDLEKIETKLHRRHTRECHNPLIYRYSLTRTVDVDVDCECVLDVYLHDFTY